MEVTRDYIIDIDSKGNFADRSKLKTATAGMKKEEANCLIINNKNVGKVALGDSYSVYDKKVTLVSPGRLEVTSGGVSDTSGCIYKFSNPLWTLIGFSTPTASTASTPVSSIPTTYYKSVDLRQTNKIFEGPTIITSRETGIKLAECSVTFAGPTTVKGGKGGGRFEKSTVIFKDPTTIRAEAGAGIELSESTMVFEGLTTGELTTIRAFDTGIQAKKKCVAHFNGAITIRSEFGSAFQLADGCTMIFTGPTIIHAGGRAKAAVQVENSSWNSSGKLSIDNPSAALVNLKNADFKHQGSLDLSQDRSLTFKGEGGELQLNKLHCSRDSKFNINGDYKSFSISEVIFDSGNDSRGPVELNFHLSSKNQPSIGPFFRENSKSPETISEITDSDQIAQLTQSSAANDSSQVSGTHYYGIFGEAPNGRNLLISTNFPLFPAAEK
jgi:hypothetical protein